MPGWTRWEISRSVAPEQRLRGGFHAHAIPRRRCSGATLREKTTLGPHLGELALRLFEPY